MTIDQLRLEFEAREIESGAILTRCPDGRYLDSVVQAKWEGYLMAALPAQVPVAVAAAPKQAPDWLRERLARWAALSEGCEDDFSAGYDAARRWVAMQLAAAPSAPSVAHEAGAQGVDVGKVMALVEEYGEQCEAAGYLDRSGSQDASKKLHDAAHQTAVKIRALLSAPPAVSAPAVDYIGHSLPMGDAMAIALEAGIESAPISCTWTRIFDLIDAAYNHGRRQPAPAVSAERVTEWQPIETAPKDGRLILAFRPTAPAYGDDQIVICRTTAAKQFAWDGGDNYTDRANTPTHWQPLPAPPAIANQEPK